MAQMSVNICSYLTATSENVGETSKTEKEGFYQFEVLIH
jgi:hypothetical protein